MAEHERTIARVIETLREPVRIDPSLDDRVMAAIEPVPRPETRAAGRRALLAWLRRRRTIQLSPLGGLAMAAGLAALVLAGSRIAAPREEDRSGASEPGYSAQVTQFVLVAPAAASVTLVGDFNDWSLSATPLVKEAGDGMWWVALPLSPGRYRYAFIVDGATWRGDPNAPAAEDEFGRPSSVVSIGGV